MASAQVDELFNAAFEFAKRMLSQHRSFHPFGVSMAPDGKVAMVAGYTGSEHPPAQDVIDLLQSTFIDQAKGGAIQAAGVCLDVRVVPPGESAKSDAVCVRLASISGEAVEVYVPYREPLLGAHKFGATFATRAQVFHLHGA